MSQPAINRNVGNALTGFERLVTQERVNDYADASGDHNPIHLDEAYAATTPFGTRIAHMACSAWLWSPRCWLASFRSTWHTGGKLKVRFSAPIIPGETVTTYGEITSIDDSDVWANRYLHNRL